MRAQTGVLLALMMFLEYYIWSSWYVTMSTYMKEQLHATGVQVGAAYSALAIATMISPFFVGMVADRFFAAQKIMGVLHLTGALLLFASTRISDTTAFYWIILLYSLVYMPTIALSNSVAFHQMTDPGRQFPWIRVFGTVGWIVAGNVISFLDIAKTPSTFLMGSIASVALGLLSFALPDTPPGRQAATAGKAIGSEAFVLLKNKAYLVFFVAAILLCIPLSFYYGFANFFLERSGVPDATSKMTLGQLSEAVFILAIPFLFNTVGVRNMLLMGMAAWILRYLCFAYGDAGDSTWLLYAGIILHGICYDFFFVTGYMYTEKKAGERIKNSAQGLLTFATYGLGMFIGTWVSGFVVDRFEANEVYDWQKIWFVPAAIAAAVLLFFITLFREKRETAATLTSTN